VERKTYLHPAERYVTLRDNIEVVLGAQFSLLINFKTGGLHHLNQSASEIMKLFLSGSSIEQVLQHIHTNIDDVKCLLDELHNLKLIDFTVKPGKAPDKDVVAARPELSFIWIEVTNHCNLHCIHCYAQALSGPGNQPDAEQICSWLDQAAALGCRKVQFTGGECTLRHDLIELFKYAKQTGFETIEIFTNGIGLNENLIRFLAENSIHVALSLYSFNAATHDRITGIPGSYEKTMSSLKYILAYNVQVRGSIIALKQNEKEVNATRVFLEQLGVPSGPADPIRPCGRGLDMTNWPSDYGLTFMRTTPDLIVDKQLYDTSLYWNNCWFGKAAITATGNVIPCVFAREQVAGNLNTHTLQEILNNGLLSCWQLSRDKITVCKDCEYRYLCKDCRPWAFGYTGDLIAKSPTCTYNPYTGEWSKAETAMNKK